MDSALTAVLINAGVAGVVVALLTIGWLVPKWAYSRLLDENKSLREALELERTRAGETASTYGVTNKLIGALVDLAAERKGVPPPAVPQEPAGLTGKDLA